MVLPPHELKLFFRLHRTVMFFVNQRLKVIANNLATPEEFAALAPEVRLIVRNALVANVDLIESFVAENPAGLSDDDLAIVRPWRYLIHGKFFVFRKLKKYTVFLSTDRQPVAYGVSALSQPFEDLIGPNLPVLTQTVLLPYKEKIVYDGLMSNHRISFGLGIRQNLARDFKDAKARHGIVTTLPIANEPKPPKEPKTKPIPKAPSKEEKGESLAVIVGLIDRFCNEHLNEAYAVLCRKMVQQLSRKRPSPLLQGSPNAWASGIVRAVGGVNFLHDKSQSPYMRSTDIDRHLGTSPSSGAVKLAAIREMLHRHQLDPHWMLPSRLEDNPLVWMLRVNGHMVDVRHAPRVNVR